jgi:Xaa-Pro aminopeptidase
MSDSNNVDLSDSGQPRPHRAPRFDRLDPISRSELERRWALTRKMMELNGIDVLIAQNLNSFHGGYVKWLTDTPAENGGYIAVLFPRNDDMVAFRHGPTRKAQADSADPGVSAIWTEPTFAAVDFTKHLHSDRVIEEIRHRGYRRAGIVGTAGMSHAFLSDVKAALNIEFVDATQRIDEMKAIKSLEEIEFIRETAVMQDVVFDEVLKFARPGRRLFELSALAQYEGQRRGSTQGLFLVGGGPVGTPAAVLPRHMQGYTLKPGDHFSILIENNGPGGFYTEIGRTCVFGKPSSRMREEFEFTLSAQRFTLNLLVPGAAPAEIIERYNDFMRANGRPAEDRLHCHSQGYDLVERPLATGRETIPIAANMNIACHPTYVLPNAFSWICDNYLVGDGACERLHKTPQKIFDL